MMSTSNRMTLYNNVITFLRCSSDSQSCFAVVANESKARPAASRMAVQKLCSDASESFSPRDANAENEWRCARGVRALRAFVVAVRFIRGENGVF
ncbi:unnamed protein product [Bathycoccus prasinos]